MSVDKRVTIFVGDNGCGKSTLLESLVYVINLPLIGRFSKSSAGFEAALSPLKQLSLLALINEIVKSSYARFLIATHSPILMGMPGALLYEIGEDGMKPVSYEVTDHYRITKTFLTKPDTYLRHMR